VYLHFYCENQEEMEYWGLLVAAADHVMKFGIECFWWGAAYRAPRSSQSLPFDQEGKMLLLLLCPVSLLMNSSGAMMMTFGCVTLMQQLGVKLLKGSNIDHGEEEMKKKKKSGSMAVLLSMIAAFRLSFPEEADSGSLLAQCPMKLQIHDHL
jgi:hypothetical protein